MRLREKVAQQLPLRRKNTGRIVEDYVFLCIYASRRNALNSACAVNRAAGRRKPGAYSRPEAGGGKFDVFGVPSTLINDRTGYKNVCFHVQDDFKSLQSLPRRTSS
jgi:hypothetical protein